MAEFLVKPADHVQRIIGTVTLRKCFVNPLKSENAPLPIDSFFLLLLRLLQGMIRVCGLLVERLGLA